MVLTQSHYETMNKEMLIQGSYNWSTMLLLIPSIVEEQQ